MAYKQISPVTVPEGATGLDVVTAYSVMAAGPTSDSSFDEAEPIASTTAVLTSNGAGSAPSFHEVDDVDQFRFQLLAADPGAPTNGQVWYNTTSNLFKGVKNSSILTFDVT